MVLLASALGQIGLPGGGFGFGYGSGAGIGDAPLSFAAPAMDSIKNPINVTIPAARISDCLLHPGEPYDFNGKRGNYPDIQPGLLGRRQSVPSSSGHQQAPPRLAAARDRRGARAVVDRDRASCRYRAAGNHIARAQRHRRRAPRQVHHRHAAGGRAGGAGAQRFRDLQRSGEAARRRRGLHAGPRRECVAPPSLRRLPPQRRRQRCGAAGLRYVLAERLSGNPRCQRGIRDLRRFPRRSGKAQAADAIRQDRALLGKDRGLRLRRLPAASDLDRAVGMARRQGRQDLSAASRVESAARPAAQPDGLRAGQRQRQGRGPRGDHDQSGGCKSARHQRRRRGARAQLARLVPCRRHRQRHRSAPAS